MLDRTGFSLGYCFGTILMRSSKKEVYYSSIDKELKKARLYLVTVGDEEDEESFWMSGRELFTLYTTPTGFSCLSCSQLEKDLTYKLSDSDYSIYKNVLRENTYRNLSDNPVYRNPKDKFNSLQDVMETVKPLGKSVTIYSIQTKTKPYYLEEILHYAPEY